MRSVTTAFQVSIYSMMLLSSLMLAYAEGAVFPQALSVPLLALAWVFTERRGILRLPPWGANLLGLAAFGLALLELTGNNEEARLLSGAHLLIYLSWVVIFQQKRARQYWWMSALSVLQVAVGSVLTATGPYGLLLFFYFCGTIWTLSLFSLWQTQERLHEELPASLGNSSRPDERSAAVGEGESSNDAAGESVAARRSRIAAALHRPSEASSTMHVDPEERWLGLRFALGSALTAACSMSIASLFFLLIPRHWVGTLNFGNEQTAPSVRSLTGFTEKVRLGDIGRIMESTEPVLAIRLFDQNTDASFSVEDYCRRIGLEEPLFRGAVLAYYEDGDWTGGSMSGRLESLPSRPPDEAPRVRQEITLHPIGTDILLALHPVTEARLQGGGREVGRYRFSEVLAHSDRNRPRTPQSYVAYSPHPSRPKQGALKMSDLPPPVREAIRIRCLQLPEKGVEQLKAEARRVAGMVAGQPRPSNEEMKDRLVEWLREKGGFEYSLDSSVSDGSLDPVEDFLIVRKRGHCEYYASALALMLRSVGIPSRLVSGFKGGKVNRITGAFEVEQRHAHAWVEALIDDEWLVVDATPAAPRTESVAALDPELPAVNDLMRSAREFWMMYVVNMNYGQQSDRFYAPLQGMTNTLSELLMGGQGGPEGLLWRLWKFFSSPEEWISGRGFVITFLLLCLGSGIVWTGRRLAPLLRNLRRRGRRDSAAKRRRVEFYERFCKVCSSAGVSRRPSETQREFGQLVGAHWALDGSGNGMHDIPSDLTEAFYRVRFGDEVLSASEAAEIDQSLSRFERAVSTPKR